MGFWQNAKMAFGDFFRCLWAKALEKALKIYELI